MLNSRILKFISVLILNCFIFSFILTNIVPHFAKRDSVIPTFNLVDLPQYKVSLVSCNKTLRIIRGVYDPEDFLPKVQEIFDAVVSGRGLEGIVHLPYSDAIVFAHLLALSYSRGRREIGERLVENYIDNQLSSGFFICIGFNDLFDRYRIPYRYRKGYRKVIREAYDLIAGFYQDHKRIFPGIKLPSYREWENMISFRYKNFSSPLIDFLSGGVTYKYFNKIIIEKILPPKELLRTLVHEGLHIIFPGFFNKLIDEGSTQFFTNSIIPPQRVGGNGSLAHYPYETGIAEEISEKVGESILLRSYAEGKLDLIENVGLKVIELWKLTELLPVVFVGKDKRKIEESIMTAVISQYPGAGVSRYKANDPISVCIWKNRDSQNVLDFIEAQIYHYIGIVLSD